MALAQLLQPLADEYRDYITDGFWGVVRAGGELNGARNRCAGY